MRAATWFIACWFSVSLTACGDNVRGAISIDTPAAWQPAFAEFVALTPYGGLTLGTAGDYRIQLAEDSALGSEAYRLESGGTDTIVVRANGVLGAQYGAAAALEALGFRFRHPFDAFVPAVPELVAAEIDGVVHAPQIRVRGMQLHTLHPIEGYYAFWEPTPGSTNDAHRIIDWLVKNRGNFLQWVSLDDILDPVRHEKWKVFTRELIDYAHMRGIRVGLNLQLFGASNLQLAFDLVDKSPDVTPIADQIAARLPLITKDLPFDVYDLSFGEFFNADPATFISSVNEVKNQLDVLAPAAEMHAVIHVGADQVVTYMGEELLYYFLVKFADPEIIHDVHSTMFYNLFETTSGAYHHESFSEHRDYLLAQICSGKPGSYFPETAYWVAFDNSVPQFFPIYVHNRWLDLDQIRKQAPCPTPLDQHLLFSSGWEWGYWLHDVTALRASYELPAAPSELVDHAFGRDLAPATPAVLTLIELQRTYLHFGDLVAYIAGRDLAIDAGRQLGIVSQPDRVTYADLVAGADVTEFRTDVMLPLEAYANALDAVGREIAASELPTSTWGDELRDGIEIDQLRTRFVIETYEAVLAHLAGDDAAAIGHADAAARLMERGQIVVTRRHGDLHDTHRRRLLDAASTANPNQTFYQFGYLYMADTLCYWQRELVQVEGVLSRTSMPPPGCVFP
ncbi:MAG: hypothetical protein H0T89_21285 [Deltaproteobacteria bacterium]|nr:hypothetical protein [Deltaproteobacteria bacterium]MDQ3300221.1 hypothetical protein [Myxococcota bacterium]